MNLNPDQPHRYPRRILLAATGLSPQIVTETLYALAVRPESGRPAYVPTEVHLITTVRGREQAVNNLLMPTEGRPGWFQRLCSDYSLPKIRFDESCIHVIAGADGNPMEDIRTPHDNECAADFITEIVREMTGDATAALHVSLAGGRKTMGFYLGYALSLFARPQDRLSHVLVSRPFESNPDFYYPTPYDQVLQTRDAPPLAVNARDAQISLAEIPIVSLRHGLPKELIEGKTTFNATVTAARAALAPPELIIDVRNRRICAAGRIIDLEPALFAVMAVLAYRTKTGLPPLRAPAKDCADQEWCAEYLRDLEAACGAFHVPESVEAAIEASKSVIDDYFAQKLSKLRRRITAALGPAADTYGVDKGRSRQRQYKLAIPPESIRFAQIDRTT